MSVRHIDALMARRDRERDLGFLKAGIVASVIANVNRAKGARAYSPWDFVPGAKREPHQQTAEEQIAIFKSISEVVN